MVLWMSGHVHVVPDGQELDRVQVDFYILETQLGEVRTRVTDEANVSLDYNTKTLPILGILQSHTQ
jgi:hypothetical protein